MKAVGIYTRVSTGDQNAGMQLEELRAYCQARGWTIFKEYSDTVSGSTAKRPGLDHLLGHVRVGRIDCVLIWKYDRMSRSLTHLIDTVDMLSQFNCNFISLKENFDTTTPVGRCMVSMIAAFAEFERSTIRSRVKAGIEYAKIHGTKTGNAIGRPKAIFDRKAAEEMRASGVSQHGIARALGVSQATIWKAMR